MPRGLGQFIEQKGVRPILPAALHLNVDDDIDELFISRDFAQLIPEDGSRALFPAKSKH